MVAVIHSIWHLPAFFGRHIHQSMGLLAATADVVAQLELSLNTLGRRFPCRVLRDESYWAHNFAFFMNGIVAQLELSEEGMQR